jgi:hypothetical protein
MMESYVLRLGHATDQIDRAEAVLRIGGVLA